MSRRRFASPGNSSPTTAAACSRASSENASGKEMTHFTMPRWPARFGVNGAALRMPGLLARQPRRTRDAEELPAVHLVESGSRSAHGARGAVLLVEAARDDLPGGQRRRLKNTSMPVGSSLSLMRRCETSVAVRRSSGRCRCARGPTPSSSSSVASSPSSVSALRHPPVNAMAARDTSNGPADARALKRPKKRIKTSANLATALAHVRGPAVHALETRCATAVRSEFQSRRGGTIVQILCDFLVLRSL